DTVPPGLSVLAAADPLFRHAAQGPGGQGSGEPQQAMQQTHGGDQPHGPAGDDQIAQIVGLQDGGQSLGGAAGLLAFKPLPYSFGTHHGDAPARCNMLRGRTLWPKVLRRYECGELRNPKSVNISPQPRPASGRGWTGRGPGR